METKNTTDSSSKEKEEDITTLRDILELFIRRWHWFLLAGIVCFVLAWIYLSSISPVYQRTAVMLVKNEKQGVGDEITQMLGINGFVGGSSVENEIYILRSYQIMNEVVQRLHLDVSYTLRSGLRHDNIYGKLPFEVRFLDPFPGKTRFQVTLAGNKRCVLSSLTVGDDNKGYSEEVTFNDTISTPAGRLVVTPNSGNIDKYAEKTINVSRSELEVATNVFMSNIQTSAMEKQSTLVKIVCKDSNIARADAILNAILQVYNENMVEDKNRVASNTAKFIDERITIISRELGDVENKLTDFKQQNRIVDIKLNAETYLQEGAKAKEESLQLEAQLNVVEFVKDYLKDKTKHNELIPNVAGVGDAGLQIQIEEFNTMMLQRNRLVGNSGNTHPLVQNMDGNLNAMRSAIAGSIDNYLRTIRLRLKNAQGVENKVNRTIEGVPQQEKYALDVMRQQSIKETLYVYLLQKREETTMQLAVTEANIRIVEAPFGTRIPIAPKRTMILLCAFVLGVGVLFVYFHFRELWNTGVRGRKDIESATSLPILGEIPTRKDEHKDEDIAVSGKRNDRISEAFRMVRANLEFMDREAKVLMFTSTMAGEGKSFVSRNFAVMLATAGKKVVLIDTDIRKRTQSGLFGAKRKEGLSTYLSGTSTVVEQLVLKDAMPGVDLLPAGSIPPNPAELLMNIRLGALIEELKLKYDYVILDSVPALIIADASIVNRVADITIYIIREAILDRRYLPELERLYKDEKFKKMCVVVNDVHDRGGKYGYGYGYYSEDGQTQRKHISLWKNFLKKILRKR